MTWINEIKNKAIDYIKTLSDEELNEIFSTEEFQILGESDFKILENSEDIVLEYKSIITESRLLSSGSVELNFHFNFQPNFYQQNKQYRMTA